MVGDEALEAAIDGVGRERVFALAEACGWSINNPPPTWVWQALVYELRREPNTSPPALTKGKT